MAPAAAPLTVTVWVAAQVAVVNVNAPDTVAVSVSPLVGVTVTDPVGRVAKETPYVPAPPTGTPTSSAVETTTPRATTVTVHARVRGHRCWSRSRRR